MPITCDGRWVIDAKTVKEILDVFEARIASGFAILSNCVNSDFLRSKFSGAASIIMSQSDSFLRSDSNEMFLSVLVFPATGLTGLHVLTASYIN